MKPINAWDGHTVPAIISLGLVPLPPLSPLRLEYTDLSYPYIAMVPTGDYCTRAGKLLGSLMSWGRDGGLSTDSSSTTVKIT